MTPTQKLKKLEDLLYRSKVAQINYMESIKDNLENGLVRDEFNKSLARFEAYEDILVALQRNDWAFLNISAGN